MYTRKEVLVKSSVIELKKNSDSLVKSLMPKTEIIIFISNCNLLLTYFFYYLFSKLFSKYE